MLFLLEFVIFRCYQLLIPTMQPDVIVRPEGSIGLGPFHSKSKVHAEKEEVSEDR